MKDVFTQDAERLEHLKVMSRQMADLAYYLEQAGVIDTNLRHTCSCRAHDCWVAESNHWDDGRFRDYDFDED